MEQILPAKRPIGAPMGNKNAFKTGEYETIDPALLTPEEREAWEKVNVQADAQLDGEIRLLEIRARRLWERIERLRREAFILAAIEEEKADGEERVKIRRLYEATMARIMAVEEELTRIQAVKARLIELQIAREDLSLLRRRVEKA